MKSEQEHGVAEQILRMNFLFRSVFNYYIMSLCFSDLVSAMLSPFWIYRQTWGFEQWKIPTFLCKVGYELFCLVSKNFCFFH